MRKRPVIFWVMGVLLFVVVVGAFAQSGEELFQRALRLERNEGMLMEAIELYNQVVAEKGSKSLAAKAQLRIGMCYEKLGASRVEQAQEAFQKVIDNFPAQSDETRIARDKLALFTKATAVMAKQDTGFRTRKVARLRSDAHLWGGTVSPNGRYFSYVNWEKGNVAIFDLKTGEYRDLTHEGNWSLQPEFADFQRWSPDSKTLAYLWFSKGVGPGELRLVDVDGSEPRILWKEEGELKPQRWTADGRFILGNLNYGTIDNILEIESKIVLISVEDGSVRTVKDFGKIGHRAIQDKWMDLAPDERHVVYEMNQDILKSREDLSTAKADIFICAVDGGVERVLVEHPADDSMPHWTPDGSHIVFLSDRTGQLGLYALEVEDGAPKGQPELIQRMDYPSGQHLGFADDGALYYYIDYYKKDVFVGDLDPKTGKIGPSPAILSQNFEGRSFSPSWSRDGRYIAYYVQQGKAVRGKYGPVNLVIREEKTSEERELDLGNNPIRFLRTAEWGPEGEWLSLIADFENQGLGVYRVDAQTGEKTPIVIPDRGVLEQHVWSQDWKNLYQLMFFEGKQGHAHAYSIVSRDVLTGKEVVLYESKPQGVLGPIALSPDGGRLAYRVEEGISKHDSKETIWIVPVNGGEPIEIMSETTDDSVAIDRDIGMIWSADGAWLYYGRQVYPTSKKTLYRVSTKGGIPEKLGVFEEGIATICFHPDGSRLAFSVAEGQQEIWALENFLPKVKDEE